MSRDSSVCEPADSKFREPADSRAGEPVIESPTARWPPGTPASQSAKIPVVATNARQAPRAAARLTKSGMIVNSRVLKGFTSVICLIVSATLGQTNPHSPRQISHGLFSANPRR